MITRLFNDDGYIYAECEWTLTDKNGTIKNEGEYLYVQDLWIHENHRKKGTLAKLIPLIDKAVPYDFKYVFWKNLKHGERQTRTYFRENLLKLGR